MPTSSRKRGNSATDAQARADEGIRPYGVLRRAAAAFICAAVCFRQIKAKTYSAEALKRKPTLLRFAPEYSFR